MIIFSTRLSSYTSKTEIYLKVKVSIPLILFATSAIAQSSSDYIVNNSGDTLAGKIEDNNWYDLGKKIKFQNENRLSSEYLPTDIKAYKIGDYTFESIDHLKFSMSVMTIEQLVNTAIRVECEYITLQASDMGKDLYLKMEFKSILK